MTDICKLDGCDRTKARQNGLCKPHNQDWLAGRSFRHLAPKRVKGSGVCTYPECGRPVVGYGLCKPHRTQQISGRPMHAIGDKAAIAAARRAYWARLSVEERRAQTSAAVANLNKRGMHWRDANAVGHRKSWAEGRGRPSGIRLCVGCGREFTPNSGPQVYCGIECKQLSRRAVSHGMTRAELNRTYELQGDGCAVCRRVTRLVVDHDHVTGKVRGLLCTTCNTGLGKLGDSVERLREAIAYLER